MSFILEIRCATGLHDGLDCAGTYVGLRVIWWELDGLDCGGAESQVNRSVAKRR